jgi:hypothetical protein
MEDDAADVGHTWSCVGCRKGVGRGGESCRRRRQETPREAGRRGRLVRILDEVAKIHRAVDGAIARYLAVVDDPTAFDQGAKTLLELEGGALALELVKLVASSRISNAQLRQKARQLRGPASGGPRPARGLGASLRHRRAEERRGSAKRASLEPMHARKINVENGRIKLDEPTDLPDGAELEVVVIDDELSPEERAELHASLDRALDDSEAGRGMDAWEYLEQYRARREARPA